MHLARLMDLYVHLLCTINAAEVGKFEHDFRLQSLNIMLVEYWGSVCVCMAKLVSSARFELIKSSWWGQKHLFFFSTHWAHVGKNAHIRPMRLCLDKDALQKVIENNIGNTFLIKYVMQSFLGWHSTDYSAFVSTEYVHVQCNVLRHFFFFR